MNSENKNELETNDITNDTKIEYKSDKWKDIWKRNCPKCNRELIYKVKGNFIRSIKNNSMCKRCFKSLTIEEFIERSKKLHINRYNYSMAIYKNNRTKVEIICIKHGRFIQTPDAHLHGQGCPVCKKEILIKINTITKDEFINRSMRIHNRKYDYSNIDYKNGKIKANIICPFHGEFFQRPSDHLKGHGCPKCINIISKKEQEFLDYLQVPNTKENRQVCISRKKVDGIKDNIIYEFLGDYWHGNPDRFNHKNINCHAHKTFGKLYSETFLKFDKLKELGYIIYYIWENDWKIWNKEKSYPIPMKKF